MRFWEPAFEGAGLEYVKPYAWRHTYATWCLAAGINTFVLAKRMGTSLAMIDRTYGHLVKDSAEIERSLLDAWDVTGGFPTGMDTSGTFDALRMGETK
jgi:integrase